MTAHPSLQLGVLDELLAITSAAKTVEDILDQSLSIILKHVGESIAAVYLYQSDVAYLVSARGIAVTEGIERMAMNSDILEACRPDAAIISLLEESATPCPLADVLRATGQQRALAVPLMVGDSSIGCMLIASSVAEDEQPPQSEFLHTIGRAVGLAVDNSRLYAKMDRRLHESETLYQISRAFASTLDLDALLSLIVRSAVEQIPEANNCVLHLLDEPTGELRPRALSFGGVRPNRSGQTRMRRGQGVAGIALETGQVANIVDVSKDSRFLRVNQGRSYASLLVAPLRLADRPIGTLSIDSSKANAFHKEDEHLAMTLATQAAAAIDNARLVKSLQESLQELQETQAQLVQSAKLSAIGQLIAGVAHELNNPLTAVMGYTQLLQTTEGIDESVLRDLTKIYQQAKRAAKIVQNLLTFARAHKAERQFVDVNETLQRTLELRNYQLRVEDIQVVTEYAPEEIGVMADPHQLQQVFLNLINNAQDAINDFRGAGTLTVVSERHDDKVWIKFVDDGPGLSPEAEAHIFEPFYTTKEVGKGTGLGLSICFGIVSQYGGRIWAENGKQHGTTFIVELPAATEKVDPAPTEAKAPQPRYSGRLVLVVEDERDVAVVVRRILSQDGHRVLVAEDGGAALRYLDEAAEHNSSFDLIISDIKMPGLNGIALYDKIAEKAPELVDRIIFVTGDTMSPRTQLFLKRAGQPYLTKPFTIAQLRAAATQVFMKVGDGAVREGDPAPQA